MCLPNGDDGGRRLIYCTVFNSRLCRSFELLSDAYHLLREPNMEAFCCLKSISLRSFAQVRNCELNSFECVVVLVRIQRNKKTVTLHFSFFLFFF